MAESSQASKIFEQLAKNQNIVVTSSSRDHETLSIDIFKLASKKFGKICVATMHKPFIALIAKLEEAGIDYSNYCVVDCASAKAPYGKASTLSKYVHLSSPAALTEMFIALTKMIESESVDLLILDNISTLLMYNQDVLILRFMHSLMTKIRNTKTKAIYLVLRENNERVIADLTLFSDAVIWA